MKNCDIYLDNASACPPDSHLLDFFKERALDVYANQEAIHGAAYSVRKLLDSAAESLLKAVTGSNSGSLFWCNSGTEGLNIIMKHPAFKSGNIVTTGAEHPALANAIATLDSERTIEIRYVNLLSNGKVNVDHLEQLLDNNTLLFASHYVQSETGVIQDFCGFREILNRKAPNALFLADTVQAVGKIEILWESAKLDFAFLSGHKVGAPFGGAILFRDNKYKFKDYLTDLRIKHHSLSRVEPALALTLTKGVQQVVKDIEKNWGNIFKLNSYAREKLSDIKLKSGKNIEFTTEIDEASPFILHFTVPDFQAAVLVRMLSKKSIMIAAGSACMAEVTTPSNTLMAMGFSQKKAYASLRVSFWLNNNYEDIDQLADELQNVIDDF